MRTGSGIAFSGHKTILCKVFGSNVHNVAFLLSGDLNYSGAAKCQGTGLILPAVSSLYETRAWNLLERRQRRKHRVS